jgi:hypothetical protein
MIAKDGFKNMDKNGKIANQNNNNNNKTTTVAAAATTKIVAIAFDIESTRKMLRCANSQLHSQKNTCCHSMFFC